jgi:plastocyanin
MTARASTRPPRWPALVSLAIASAAAPGACGTVAAQSYLERTPHVDGGWIGLPGMLYMDDWALFRTTAAEGDGLLAMPVYRALLSLPTGVLIGGTLAANARGDGRDVLEVFARLGRPRSLEEDGWAFGLTAGYSRPAGSLDGELSLWKALGPFRALAAARGYSDLDGRGGQVAVMGGAVVPVTPGRTPLALAADLGYVPSDGSASGLLWSVGLHAGIASTPFTVAFQASNARDPGFQGAALEGDEVHFGVAVMSPIPVGPLFGWAAPRERALRSVRGGLDPAPAMRRVSIARHAYWPLRIEIDAGTVIEWVNEDPARHTVTALDGSFDSGSLSRGQRWRARFGEPGTYLYHCAPHPFMQAVVVVR